MDRFLTSLASHLWTLKRNKAYVLCKVFDLNNHLFPSNFYVVYGCPLGMHQNGICWIHVRWECEYQLVMAQGHYKDRCPNRSHLSTHPTLPLSRPNMRSIQRWHVESFPIDQWAEKIVPESELWSSVCIMWISDRN